MEERHSREITKGFKMGRRKKAGLILSGIGGTIYLFVSLMFSYILVYFGIGFLPFILAGVISLIGTGIGVKNIKKGGIIILISIPISLVIGIIFSPYIIVYLSIFLLFSQPHFVFVIIGGIVCLKSSDTRIEGVEPIMTNLRRSKFINQIKEINRSKLILSVIGGIILLFGGLGLYLAPYLGPILGLVALVSVLKNKKILSNILLLLVGIIATFGLYIPIGVNISGNLTNIVALQMEWSYILVGIIAFFIGGFFVLIGGLIGITSTEVRGKKLGKRQKYSIVIIPLVIVLPILFLALPTYHINSFNPLWSFSADENLNMVEISDDGNYIVSATDWGGQENLRLFEKSSNIPLWSYSPGISSWSYELRAVKMSSDGNYIVAGYYNYNSYRSNVALFGKSSNVPLWDYSGGADSFLSNLVISSDGNYVVASIGKNVHFFNKSSPVPLWTYTAAGEYNYIDYLAISSNGSYIAITDNDGLHLLSNSSSTPLWSYTPGGWLNFNSLAMSSNGNYIVADILVGGGNCIYLFDTSSSTPLWLYTGGEYMSQLSISSDGSSIAACNYMGDVFLFRKSSPTPFRRFNEDWNTRIALSSDGNYFVIATDKVQMFDESSNVPLWIYGFNDNPFSSYFEGINSIAISSNGSYIALCYQNGLHLFRGDNPYTPEIYFRSIILGYILVVAGMMYLVIRFIPLKLLREPKDQDKISKLIIPPTAIEKEVLQEEILPSSPEKKPKELDVFEEEIITQEEIPVEKEVKEEVVVVTPEEVPIEKEVVVEETIIKVPEEIEGIKTLKMHKMGVTSVAISPNGNYAVSGSKDKTIKIWEFPNGKLVRNFLGHDKYVTSVAISSDGKYLITGSNDKTVKAWELSTGQLIQTFKGHSLYVLSVAITNDGNHAVSSSFDKDIKVWDLKTGNLAKTLKGHKREVESVAVSPDGKYIASGSNDKTVKIWSLTSGENLTTIEGHKKHVTSIIFSPDGKYLVSGSNDKSIKVWKMPTGELVRTFEGHTMPVLSVAISPDCKYLVSGSFDKDVKLWDFSTGNLIKTFKGHKKEVNSVAFSPDNRYIISGSSDKTIKIWED